MDTVGKQNLHACGTSCYLAWSLMRNLNEKVKQNNICSTRTSLEWKLTLQAKLSIVRSKLWLLDYWPPIRRCRALPLGCPGLFRRFSFELQCWVTYCTLVILKVQCSVQYSRQLTSIKSDGTVPRGSDRNIRDLYAFLELKSPNRWNFLGTTEWFHMKGIGCNKN